jgi:hypothetical protein
MTVIYSHLHLANQSRQDREEIDAEMRERESITGGAVNPRTGHPLFIAFVKSALARRQGR